MAELTVRRRSVWVCESVMGAVLELIRDGGIDQVTVAQVAGGQACMKNSSIAAGEVEQLLIEAILDLSEADLPVPDTGSFREGLDQPGTQVVPFYLYPAGLGGRVVAVMVRKRFGGDGDSE